VEQPSGGCHWFGTMSIHQPTKREAMIGRLNLAGAVVADWIYAVSILVFVLRLLQMPRIGHWIGLGMLLAAFPLGYLLITSPSLGRSTLYYF